MTPEAQTKETRKTQVAFSKLLALAYLNLFGIYYKVQATVRLKSLKIKQNVYFIQGPIVSLNSFYNMNNALLYLGIYECGITIVYQHPQQFLFKCCIHRYCVRKIISI